MGGHVMDAKRGAWIEQERSRWQVGMEAEWELFDVGPIDVGPVDDGWVFDDDDEPCRDDLVTVAGGDASETMLSLSRSLATAFLIADIGIRLTCLDHEFDGDGRFESIGESLRRYYETLCHSVEEADGWRVETAIGCLRERLQPVASFGTTSAMVVAELESLLGRLQVRCVGVHDAV